MQAKKQAEAEAPELEREFTREQVQSIIDTLNTHYEQGAKLLKSLSPKVEVTNFPKFPEAKDTSDKIVAAIKSIVIPDSADDTNVVNALKSLGSQNVALLNVIKALDMRPEVKIDAPVLNVPETDFKPVIKAIKEAKPEPTTVDLTSLEKLMRDNIKASESVKTAIKGLVFPVANTPTDPLINYLASDIDDGGTVQYFGYTDNRGAWYIRKYDTSVTPKTIRLCFGQSNYATNWSNRVGLAYSTWGS